MNTPLTERKYYFDNLKGILILLVVFTHCLYDFQSSARIHLIIQTIYVFHMPAFIFVSGYLSKSEHSRSVPALLKLFSAYLLFNTLLMLYQYQVNSIEISLLTPYHTCWYLLALIVWRFIVKRASKIKGILPLSILFALTAGFSSEFNNLLSLARIAAFFPFFLAGFLLPTKKIEHFISHRKLNHYLEGGLLLAVSVPLASLFAHKYHISLFALQMFCYENPSGFVIRAFLFVISALIILGLWFFIPDKKLPWLSTIGKNSLSIFLLHRIPTLLLCKFFGNSSDWKILAVAILVTLLLTSVFGTNVIAAALQKLLDFLTDLAMGQSKSRYARVGKIGVVLTFIAILATLSATFIIHHTDTEPATTQTSFSANSNERIYPQMNPETAAAFDDDLTLLFAGDLILLEDQVKRGYHGESYDFSDVFAYAKEYIRNADIAIGVFEGPTAGEKAGYSTSNYEDGKTISLNYPDEFAYAVKEAGFDLVTTANNHLLDKGVAGALRTLDVLDQTGLLHTGSYRNREEKESVLCLEKDGVKIAVLSYTYGSNGYSETELLNPNMSYLTSLTAVPSGEHFEEVKALVAADFARAKAENPDIICVIPHMGTQFEDFPDEYQKTWNQLFLSYGADLILNDHTHSVQPVEVLEQDGKTRVIVNCPGNFSNIYREHNGDACAMVEIYIDKTDKTVTGAAVIPMWTQSPLSGNYRALPIYTILHDTDLQKEISTYDTERIEEVQKHITKIMLGTEIDCDVAEERYFLTKDGYLASPAAPAVLPEDAKDSILYEKLTAAKSVCYIGDSITEGTVNGGFGWYRPLESLSPSVSEYAKGGGTTRTILPGAPTDADLYVVALGTNDVRYRDDTVCAMTADAYLEELENFVNRVRLVNPKAEFAFIAPWMALENDTVSALPPAERDRLLLQYTEALSAWCLQNGHIYSNPNPDINAVLFKEVQSDYMVDYIHPNRTKGIALYSIAVLKNSRLY